MPTGAREPVRGSALLIAVTAVLTLLGVRLAGLDLGTAGTVATGLAPIVAGEIGRRFAWAPATVRQRERDLRTAAIAGELLPPAPVARDPGWLRRYWPVGLAVAALAFVGPEAFAIVSDGEGGTLSEWSRDQLGTSTGQATAGWWTLTAVLAGFAVWFPVHLRRGWPWERRSGGVRR